MIPSQKCIDLVKEYESCVLKPYLDKKGVATIGWGNTFYLDGSPVTLKDPPITQLQADELFMAVLSGFGSQVFLLLGHFVNQNQFDALVSLAYNIGIEALGTSDLLALVNQGDYQQAAQHFLLWNHINGVPDKGLLERREAERELFLS